MLSLIVIPRLLSFEDRLCLAYCVCYYLVGLVWMNAVFYFLFGGVDGWNEQLLLCSKTVNVFRGFDRWAGGKKHYLTTAIQETLNSVPHIMPLTVN